MKSVNAASHSSLTQNVRRPTSRLHLYIALGSMGLMVLGMLNLHSASIGTTHFDSQIRPAIVALILFGLTGWVIPLRFFETHSYWIYGAIVVSLLIVTVTGHSAYGSQRWILLGPISFQPSEFAKVAVALVVAHFFHYHPSAMAYRIRDLWPIMLSVGVIFVLIFQQPDFGTAGMCLIVALAQVAFVRIDLRSVSISLGTFFLLVPFGWFFLLRDYQRSRVLTLINPDADPSGAGYNALQSLVAIGSGGLFGKGFQAGTQTQLHFLPARYTDFVFSVFAEEHGFWAGAAVFTGYGIVTFLMLEVARQAKDTFSSLLAVGIAAQFFIQFTINVAMVLGAFPVVGMPLPLFSKGGSSLLSICIGLGIVVAIHRRSQGRSDTFTTIMNPVAMRKENQKNAH